jgi:hypothetical protein
VRRMEAFQNAAKLGLVLPVRILNADRLLQLT